jgi:basic amino acid/polyamine antiporter, APA family
VRYSIERLDYPGFRGATHVRAAVAREIAFSRPAADGGTYALAATRQPRGRGQWMGEPVATSGPLRHLTWLDAVALILGIVIGSGVFVAPALVARSSSSAAELLTAWVLGGLLCLCGALSYAELATAYPHAGGEYLYLTRAFGRALGFFFVWSRLTVIQTGAIAAAAYIFGDYASQLAPLGPHSAMLYALAAAAALTATNAVGVRFGKWAQNVLTSAKLLGIVAITVVGLCWPLPAVRLPARRPT